MAPTPPNYDDMSDAQVLRVCIETLCHDNGARYGNAYTPNTPRRPWEQGYDPDETDAGIKIYNNSTNEEIGEIISMSVTGGPCRPYNGISVWYTLGYKRYQYDGNICRYYFREQLQQFAAQFTHHLRYALGLEEEDRDDDVDDD